MQEYVAESPFSYEKNCLLYLPKTLENCRRGSREEATMVATISDSLICSTYGHTLVLFTSYTLMGKRVSEIKRESAISMVEGMERFAGRNPEVQDQNNGVLVRSCSCWEGVDFPGDMVSFSNYCEIAICGTRSYERSREGDDMTLKGNPYSKNHSTGYAEETATRIWDEQFVQKQILV